MNSIESIICLILLFMAVPDLCKKMRRPALANALFVIFGIGLAPFVKNDVSVMLIEAGKVGFLLVLFEVGLEIDLPRFKEFLRPLLFALAWTLVQFPIIFALATIAELNALDALIAAAAISGCSMSMAYFAWKRYPGLSGNARAFTVQAMVALEMLAIILLAVVGPALEHGIGWGTLFRLAGMSVTVFLIGRFSSHFIKVFVLVMEKATLWRVHFLVLLVLIVCAIGERLGLAAAKTAFFLGLFMSRAEFQNMSVEEYIAPISRRFLIPIFFVSLGLLINRQMLFSYMAWLALCGALLLLGYREIIHRRWLKTGGDRDTYLLFGPNLTLVALAANSLLEAGSRDAATWTILFGLFISMLALFLLPSEAVKNIKPPKPETAATA
jgi:Kef-type K+ transport system membrane component KefB